MASLQFKIITDILEAEKIWRTLSPNLSVFDDWDFRMCFHKYYQTELSFIAGYDGDTLIGLLPLQVTKDGVLEFWCGSYMEDNRLFIKAGHENQVPAFYDYIKTLGKKITLDYIAGNDTYTTSLPVTGYKYVLPLTCANTEAYIEQTFHGETKKKLKKRLKKVADLNVHITPDVFADFDLFVRYNLEMFADSAFRDRPHHVEIFKELLKEHPNFKARFLTFAVGEEKLAITMGLIYHDTYVSINRGFAATVDASFKEYVQIKKIEDAITLGCKYFDGMAGDYGWKERWGMQKVVQYKFEN